MINVLIVERGHAAAQAFDGILRAALMTTRVVTSGRDALDMLAIHNPDVMLLELALPDMTGHEVLRRARAAGSNAPVIILTGIDDVDNKLKAYGLGADDYITKPCHREELVARILAVARRAKGRAQSVIRTGRLCVNLDAKTVDVGGKAVHLTGKEYQVLELLSLRKGTTLTKEMFMSHLYGGVYQLELKIIDVYIYKLRKKLSEATGGEDFIKTVWGRGYVLEDPNAP